MDPLPYWAYWAYTALLFVGHISFGITSSLYGPTLADLAYLQTGGKQNPDNGLNLGDTALFFSFYCGGCITGALWTGLYKYNISKRFLNRQLITSIFLMVSSVVHSLIPQTRSYYALFATAYGAGFGAGTWNAVVTTWLMEMWSGKVLASILQAVQALYGVGGILSPLLARPFLHQGVQHNDQQYTANNGTNADDLNDRRLALTIPYAVSGLMQFFVGFLVLALFFLAKYRPRRVVESSDDDRRQDVDVFEIDWADKPRPNRDQTRRILDEPGHRCQRLLFHVLMVSVFFAYHGAEIGFSSFQNAYFIKHLHMDAKKAADLSSIGAAAYTIGRGINVIIIRFLSSVILLYGHFTLAAIGFGSLYLIRTFDGPLQWWSLIVDCSLIGYAQSAIFSACFAYIDIYTKVDDRHNSIYFTAIGLPMLFVPIAVNNYIDQVPDIVVHISFGAIMVSLTLYAAIQCMIRRLN